MSKIKKVTRYMTTDSKTYQTMGAAELHQSGIENAEAGNSLLEAGETIGAILEFVGHRVCDDVLFKVTKDSRLVISHWQCSETPGYQPLWFETGMNMRVFGDAGSLNGPYGATISIRDVARYANDERSEL